MDRLGEAQSYARRRLDEERIPRAGHGGVRMPDVRAVEREQFLGMHAASLVGLLPRSCRVKHKTDVVAHKCYYATMTETERIGVRELRQYASRYIEHAEHGTTVEITRHGRPVVRMTAITDPDDRVAALEAQGVVRRARTPQRLVEITPLPPPPGPGSASEELARMRDEERW